MSAAARAWATAAELAGLPGLPSSERGVKARAQREGWAARKRRARGGGLEYAIQSLPAEARAAPNPAAPRARLKAALDANAAADTREAGLARLAELDDAQRARVEARAFLVAACRDFIARRALTKRAGVEAFAAMYTDEAVVQVPEWVRTAVPSMCARSIWTWAKDTRDRGIAGLADKRGNHRRGAGRIDSDPELRDLVVGMIAARPQTSAKHVMRALRARYQDAEPARIPAYRTVQRFMAKWKRDNEQLFAALRNPDTWRSKYLAAGGDASEAVTSLNGLWEMDSTPGDMLLADGKRHAIIGAIDVWSRRVKLHLARTSNSVAVAACLRKSLLSWGVPRIVRTDNGSDYVSRHVVGALGALEVERDLCLPGQPHTKPFIERVFGTMTRCMVEILPGYIGHDVAERKDIEARGAQARRLLKKGGVCELRMTPAQFQTFLDEWCDNLYAHDAHQGLGGRTPFERAAEWTGPVPGIADERALDILLAEAPGGGGWRTVTKKGIRLDRLSYDHPALGGLEGRRVRLRYDEADVGRIYVFAEDGPFICIAEDPAVTGVPRPVLAVARKAHQKTTLREAEKEAKASIKAARVEDIAAEVMAHAAKKSARLAQFPRARTPHGSEDLMEAARAAGESLGEARRPRELSAEEQAAADAMFAALEGPEEPDNVTRLNPPPRGERPFFANDREWARWMIDNRDKASPDEEARLRDLMRSRSFRLLVGRPWENKEPKPRKVQG